MNKWINETSTPQRLLHLPLILGLMDWNKIYIEDSFKMPVIYLISSWYLINIDMKL